MIGARPGENLGGAVVRSWAAVERMLSKVGREERAEADALGLPSHASFTSRDAALDWLATQGLNARGRKGAKEGEEVRMVASREAWTSDCTPRTAAAIAGVSSRDPVRRRRPPRSSPFEWEAVREGAPGHEDVVERLYDGESRRRPDAWAAELARDTANADLRVDGSKLRVHRDQTECLSEVPPWSGGGWEPRETPGSGVLRGEGRASGSWLPRELTPRVMREAGRAEHAGVGVAGSIPGGSGGRVVLSPAAKARRDARYPALVAAAAGGAVRGVDAFQASRAADGRHSEIGSVVDASEVRGVAVARISEAGSFTFATPEPAPRTSGPA